MLFDDIIRKMENLPADDPFAGAILSHLKVDSTIINDFHFEYGIRKIQSGNESDLSPEEVEAVKMFKKPLPPPSSVIHSPPANEYASSLRNTLRAEKRQRTEASEYRKTNHVSTTSNICERLNSNVGRIMSPLRRSMDPDTLQLLLFLKHNREFWESERTIDFIINDHTLSDDEDEDEDDDENEANEALEFEDY